MFPEISREDIFRLETRRLWLRWPERADAAAIVVTNADPGSGRNLPFRDAAVLERWRTENEGGSALHLTLTGQGADRRPIGAVSLAPVRGRPADCGLKLSVWLASEMRSRGFATEAVRAVVDAAFLLTGTPLVAASSGVLDPAFRRVLEKSGFAACGSGLDPTSDGRGLTASDRFRLDRKAWASLKNWRMPGLGVELGVTAGAVDASAEACLG